MAGDSLDAGARACVLVRVVRAGERFAAIERGAWRGGRWKHTTRTEKAQSEFKPGDRITGLALRRKGVSTTLDHHSIAGLLEEHEKTPADTP